MSTWECSEEKVFNIHQHYARDRPGVLVQIYPSSYAHHIELEATIWLDER
jgi:hypothetical protein